ncbi:hypothetical protein NUW54_g9073 [Trametes sanguinea]|uniref:Uncharacterized protein n=1 Tax=Trametes sanguinea TaxID=158606 RepID=A0ACC1PB52_9APHY|nr:hypothetical protein NUW54_g9073 [Trametes sanguinea]
MFPPRLSVFSSAASSSASRSSPGSVKLEIAESFGGSISPPGRGIAIGSTARTSGGLFPSFSGLRVPTSASSRASSASNPDESLPSCKPRGTLRRAGRTPAERWENGGRGRWS